MNSQSPLRWDIAGAKWPIVLLAVILLLPLPLSAAQPQDTEQPGPAVLTIDNRVIAVFRASVSNRTPEQRRAGAQERLERLLSTAEPGQITTRPITEGTAFFIGKEAVFTILHDDLDDVAGETMQEAVDRSLHVLNGLSSERARMRSWSYLMRAVAYAVATTVALLLFHVLMRIMNRRLQRHAVQLREHFSGPLRAKGIDLAEYADQVIHVILSGLRWALEIVAVYVWLMLCLGYFPWTRGAGNMMSAHARRVWRQLGPTVLETIPDLFTIAGICLAAYLLSRLVRLFAQAAASGRVTLGNLDPSAIRPTSRIVIVLIWAFALVAAYPYVPFSSSEAFKGVSLFMGVIVSLGSTSILGQVAAGMSLMYSRALKAGDYVRVNDIEGEVISLGFLSTKILALTREHVSIPNVVLLGVITRNYSQMAAGYELLATNVTLSYRVPWRLAHHLLLLAAKKTEGIGHSPEPFILQKELSDFSVLYELRACISDPKLRVRALSELHSNIQDVFNEHGVQIMTPHYENDPQEKIWVPKEKWYDGIVTDKLQPPPAP